MTGHVLLLLATKNESGTIDSVLQEVSESFSTLEKFGWTFELLIVNGLLTIIGLLIISKSARLRQQV